MVFASPTRPSLLHILRDDFDVQVAAVTRRHPFHKSYIHEVLSNHSSFVETLETPRDETGICEEIIRTQSSFSLNSHSSTNNWSCSMMKAESLEAFLGVPLMLMGNCAGVLLLMSKQERIWSKSEIGRLRVYADFIEKLELEKNIGQQTSAHHSVG